MAKVKEPKVTLNELMSNFDKGVVIVIGHSKAGAGMGTMGFGGYPNVAQNIWERLKDSNGSDDVAAVALMAIRTIGDMMDTLYGEGSEGNSMAEVLANQEMKERAEESVRGRKPNTPRGH